MADKLSYIHIDELPGGVCMPDVQGDFQKLVGILVAAMKHSPDMVAIVLGAVGIWANDAKVDFGAFWAECNKKGVFKRDN